MQLFCRVISKFVDILKSLNTLSPPGGPPLSSRDMRIVSTQGTVEVYETFHCQMSLPASRIKTNAYTSVQSAITYDRLGRCFRFVYSYARVAVLFVLLPFLGE